MEGVAMDTTLGKVIRGIVALASGVTAGVLLDRWGFHLQWEQLAKSTYWLLPVIVFSFGIFAGWPGKQLAIMASACGAATVLCILWMSTWKVRWLFGWSASSGWLIILLAVASFAAGWWGDDAPLKRSGSGGL